MNQKNNGRPDLNLLVVFDAVMRNRQTTAAARDLSLSQPAVSHALNRLRDLVGDQLFVRAPGGLIPTPRAERLAPKVTRMLALATEVYDAPSFDPRVSEHTFHIGVSEYATQAVVPLFLPELRRQAPETHLEMETVGGDTLARLESGMLDCTFWGAAPPPEPFSNLTLYREHFIAFICQHHPLADAAISGVVTIDQFLAYPHAIVRVAKSGASPLDLALEKLGRERRVVVGSSSFATNMASLPGTDLILSVPSRFASIVQNPKLVGFQMPLEIPEFDYSLVWHSRMDGDRAAAWFRDLIFTSMGASNNAIA